MLIEQKGNLICCETTQVFPEIVRLFKSMNNTQDVVYFSRGTLPRGSKNCGTCKACGVGNNCGVASNAPSCKHFKWENITANYTGASAFPHRKEEVNFISGMVGHTQNRREVRYSRRFNSGKLGRKCLNEFSSHLFYNTRNNQVYSENIFVA